MRISPVSHPGGGSPRRALPAGTPLLTCALLILSGVWIAGASAPAASADTPVGLLDIPLVTEGRGDSLVPTVASATVIAAVQQEQESLEELPASELQRRARTGERAAQVALGVEFAQEASDLGISAAAANAAYADAVRWYSQAATPGFPNAPALDRSGVHFFPIRVQR